MRAPAINLVGNRYISVAFFLVPALSLSFSLDRRDSKTIADARSLIYLIVINANNLISLFIYGTVNFIVLFYKLVSVSLVRDLHSKNFD